MNRSWLILVSLLFALSVHAQPTPPPGVVIPFDEDEVSTQAPERKNTPKKKTKNKDKRSADKPSFLQTAKPRKSTAAQNKTEPINKSSSLGQTINTQIQQPTSSKSQTGSIPKGTKLRTSDSKVAPKQAQKKDARKKQAKRKNKSRKKRAKKTNKSRKKQAKKRKKSRKKQAKKRKKPRKKRAKKTNKSRKKQAKKIEKPRKNNAQDIQHHSSRSPASIMVPPSGINTGATTIDPGRRKALTGVGLLETFDTPFGRLGTVSHRKAERVRERLGGRTEVDPNAISFTQGNYQMMRRYNSRIAALTDYVNATPSVLTIFIVGHADDATSLDETALLSAARASAVAEALVAKGVAAKRILAFGADSHFPLSTRSKDNRRVHFEFIHKTGPLLKPSTMLTTASLVRFSGLGTIKNQNGMRSAQAPTTLSAGTELSIDTGEAALVMPSGRLITVSGGSKLGIEKVHGTLNLKQSLETLVLHHGSIQISAATTRGDALGSEANLNSNFTLRNGEDDIEFSNASGRISAHDKRLVLTLDTGRVTALLKSGLSLSLTAGQSLVKDPKGIAIHRRLPQPVRLRPRAENPKKQVQWHKVPGAISYVLEVSSRIEFDWDIKRMESSLPVFDVETLSNRGQWYVRLFAIDQFGTMGEASNTVMGTGSTIPK